jgi:hypothetical protein
MRSVPAEKFLKAILFIEFPAGDMDRFEQEVRKLVADLDAVVRV